MNSERDIAPSADPARSEPFEARLESCDYEAGGREPDPTDFFIRIFKRVAEIGAAKLEAAHERSETERAASRDAAATVERDEAALLERKAARERDDLEYERYSRGMRYCAALAMRFHKERLEREMQKAAEVAVEQTKRRSRRKDQLERIVKEAIQHEAKERAERGDRSFDEVALLEMLPERLDEEDVERDLDRIPKSEMLARICRDMGIGFDWGRWKDQFWALEEAQANPTGSPFAAAPAAAETARAEPEPQTAEPAGLEPEAPTQQDARPPEPTPEPDNPHEARIKARLRMAIRDGGWLQVVAMDPAVASYVRARLIDSS